MLLQATDLCCWRLSDLRSERPPLVRSLVFLDRGAVGDTLFAILNYKMGNMEPEEMEVSAQRPRATVVQRCPSCLLVSWLRIRASLGPIQP